ncbi:ankyrin repeat domain-containing protein [uncultured Sphingomonas sp.]|uniref:ankyrin repeat domain-containing protein n=1 Tax=uncultured Sphingomonas sp. TaxID=158754 RepID=UPI0025FC424C|nr:ankyrin repeat domain-containing protein [uncultured Sphingomonas sp.]
MGKLKTIGLILAGLAMLAACGAAAVESTPKNGACQDVQDRDRIVDALGYFPNRLSPLGAAVLCNDAAGVERALKGGASPNAREPGGETPLLIAAAIPRTDLLKRLLASGGDPNSWEKDARTLALHYALSAGVQRDDWSAWDVLLASHADINFRPPGGATIAEDAVSLGAVDKLLQLLDRGYHVDPARLVRELEAVRYDANTEPLRLQAIERVRALMR